MAFQDTQLPSDVERGAQGGPGFNTTVQGLSSGFEKRNINWERSRGRWDISYGIDSKTNLEAVLARFYAARGKAHSFRFKDWTDYQVGSAGSPQEIAIGDNAVTKFQIKRRYTSGSDTFDREITRPVSGTLTVYLDGVLQGSGWTADYSTGVITFAVAPGSSVAIQVICEFDVPVRFDTDNLGLNASSWDGAFSLPAIELVEDKEALASLA